MEPIKLANAMQERINKLREGRLSLQGRAERKANSIGEYEKKMSMTLIKLRNGEAFDVYGETIQNPPTTIMEKIARGICYKEKIEMELREAEYKNAIVGLSCIEAELNGLQSINRHLDSN